MGGVRAEGGDFKVQLSAGSTNLPTAVYGQVITDT